MKIQLAAKINNWETFNAYRKSSNPKFKKKKLKVIKRDDASCAYCGLKTSKLEVIKVDDDYTTFGTDKMASACHLCAHSRFLDRYPIDYDGEDTMIFLPEVRQEVLNRLLRILFVTIETGDQESVYNATMTLAQLRDRATFLSENTNVPTNPGLYMYYINSAHADKKLLNQTRWLPSPESYKKHTEFWAQDIDVLEMENRE